MDNIKYMTPGGKQDIWQQINNDKTALEIEKRLIRRTLQKKEIKILAK